MTAALLRWWTVPRLNSHWNPSSTGESSTAKKTLVELFMDSFHTIREKIGGSEVKVRLTRIGLREKIVRSSKCLTKKL